MRITPRIRRKIRWPRINTQKGDPKALRISDVIDQAEWEASTFYRTCCQRLGLAYSLVLPVNVDASVVVALWPKRAES